MNSGADLRRSFRYRILLVDHCDPVLEMLGSELQGARALLSVVHTDDHAVHTSKSFRPQLFISKVDLPAIGDLAKAIEIKRCNPECKVMLLSFWEKCVDTAAILRAGDFTFHVLSRPRHPAVLFDQIETVLDQCRKERPA